MDDIDVISYLNHTAGTDNAEGSEYAVKEGADNPFNTLAGKQFVVLKSIPVMNGPFMVNTEVLSKETLDALTKAMTSDEVTNNPKIFLPKDAKYKGMFNQPQRFVTVDETWYEPVRQIK